MIIVQGIIPILPDQRERALELARRMTKATLQEVGCISYGFYVGLTDPNTLMLFQEWESMDALMGHFQTDHIDEFLRELPHVVAGEITTRRYAVQSVDEDPQRNRNLSPPIIH